VKTDGVGSCFSALAPGENGYSIFGIGVDRKQDAKWLFPQEKATSQAPQKVYMYSENALKRFSHGCRGKPLPLSGFFFKKKPP
jgi:hypothetical protein